jgi:hypothetical protein
VILGRARKKRTRRRWWKCPEEIERGQEARGLEQGEAWGEVVAVAVEEAVLEQALVETAFALNVVKENLTSWEALALRRNVPSVGRL